MVKRPQILIAEDDPDDRFLLMKAIEEKNCFKEVNFVHDGQDVIEYLHSIDNAEALPHIILLDLNMPKKNGKQALREIKSHELLCSIPVIIYSTSITRKDISECYRLGANSYIAKPNSHEELNSLIDAVYNYWFQVVRLDCRIKPEASRTK